MTYSVWIVAAYLNLYDALPWYIQHMPTRTSCHQIGELMGERHDCFELKYIEVKKNVDEKPGHP